MYLKDVPFVACLQRNSEDEAAIDKAIHAFTPCLLEIIGDFKHPALTGGVSMRVLDCEHHTYAELRVLFRHLDAYLAETEEAAIVGLFKMERPLVNQRLPFKPFPTYWDHLGDE